MYVNRTRQAAVGLMFASRHVTLQEIVNTHSAQMVKGMLGLLSLCPQEVAHLRKELLIAARHILATDLRNRFVPFIDRLFDENVLIGTGWTTHESLRWGMSSSRVANVIISGGECHDPRWEMS